MPLSPFAPAARAWFETSFERATPVQEQGWARIAGGEHALLIAPTGSGKTLAAFLYCIDRLSRADAGTPPPSPGVRVLYVSPLKALVYDIERNLRAPLVGVRRAAEKLGLPVRVPRVAVRTGDTPARERLEQARDPAEILVTTPESLYLILGSRAARDAAQCRVGDRRRDPRARADQTRRASGAVAGARRRGSRSASRSASGSRRRRGRSRRSRASSAATGRCRSSTPARVRASTSRSAFRCPT